MSGITSRTEISVAYAMLADVRQRGHIATGWRMSPKVAVRVADYGGIQVVVPEDLTDFLGLPVEVDYISDGITLLSERPGIRVAHNDPISDILTDLIAELVGDDGDGHELTDDGDHGCIVCAAIDRAEQRLREVSGD